ncbi:MAG: hypothetical protein MJ113_00790 [Lachnospiraceae bacterium]|nr:hypothetical protein [Lachnospiraceae bacterium]
MRKKRDMSKFIKKLVILTTFVFVSAFITAATAYAVTLTWPASFAAPQNLRIVERGEHYELNGLDYGFSDLYLYYLKDDNMSKFIDATDAEKARMLNVNSTSRNFNVYLQVDWSIDNTAADWFYGYRWDDVKSSFPSDEACACEYYNIPVVDSDKISYTPIFAYGLETSKEWSDSRYGARDYYVGYNVTRYIHDPVVNPSWVQPQLNLEFHTYYARARYVISYNTGAVSYTTCSPWSEITSIGRNGEAPLKRPDKLTTPTIQEVRVGKDFFMNQSTIDIDITFDSPTFEDEMMALTILDGNSPWLVVEYMTGAIGEYKQALVDNTSPKNGTYTIMLTDVVKNPAITSIFVRAYLNHAGNGVDTMMRSEYSSGRVLNGQIDITPTPSPTPNKYALPTSTPTPIGWKPTNTPTPKATATPANTATPTVKATQTPTPTVKAIKTPTPTVKATKTPTPTVKATKTPTPTVKPTTSGSNPSVYVVNACDKYLEITGGVNIRQYPNWSSEKLVTIPKGAIVHCTGVADNDWAKVEYDNVTGFIPYTYFVETSKKPTSTPVPTKKPTATPTKKANTPTPTQKGVILTPTPTKEALITQTPEPVSTPTLVPMITPTPSIKDKLDEVAEVTQAPIGRYTSTPTPSQALPSERAEDKEACPVCGKCSQPLGMCLYILLILLFALSATGIVLSAVVGKRRCPHCKKKIKKLAKICPGCGLIFKNSREIRKEDEEEMLMRARERVANGEIPASMRIQCPECGADNVKGARYCVTCAAKLTNNNKKQ